MDTPAHQARAIYEAARLRVHVYARLPRLRREETEVVAVRVLDGGPAEVDALLDTIDALQRLYSTPMAARAACWSQFTSRYDSLPLRRVMAR